LRTSPRRHFVWLIALLAAVGLVAAACGGSSSNESSTTTTAGAGGATPDFDFESLQGTLNGSGATFPKAFYEEVIFEFEGSSKLVVNYNAVGSGQGKKDLAAGTSDWAGTDSTVKDDEKANFSRLVVGTGKEALAALQKQKFDFCFLDLQLPDITGDEIYKYAKEIDPELPIVIITGYPDSQMLDNILKLGPVTVLKKPLQVEQLNQTLRILGHKTAPATKAA